MSWCVGISRLQKRSVEGDQYEKDNHLMVLRLKTSRQAIPILDLSLARLLLSTASGQRLTKTSYATAESAAVSSHSADHGTGVLAIDEEAPPDERTWTKAYRLPPQRQ